MAALEAEAVDPDEDTSPGRCTCSSCARRDELLAVADRLVLRITTTRAADAHPRAFRFFATIYNASDELLAAGVGDEEHQALYNALRAMGAVS